MRKLQQSLHLYDHQLRQIWMKNVNEDINIDLPVIIRGATALGLYRQKAVYMMNKTVSRKRYHFPKIPASDRRKQNLIVSTSQEISRKAPANKRSQRWLAKLAIGSARPFDYNIYHLVEKLSLHEIKSRNTSPRGHQDYKFKWRRIYLTIWTHMDNRVLTHI